MQKLAEVEATLCVSELAGDVILTPIHNEKLLTVSLSGIEKPFCAL